MFIVIIEFHSVMEEEGGNEIFENILNDTNEDLMKPILTIRQKLSKTPKLIWLAGLDNYKEDVINKVENWLKENESAMTRFRIMKKNLYRNKINFSSIFHPARGQNGLFSASYFEPMSVIGEFVGEYSLVPDYPLDPLVFTQTDITYTWGFSQKKYKGVNNRILNKNSFYPFAITPNPKSFGLHLANDYRGISKVSNVSAVEIWDGKYDNLPRIFFISTKEIEMDDEIVLDYGSEYWEHLNDNMIEYGSAKGKPRIFSKPDHTTNIRSMIDLLDNRSVVDSLSYTLTNFNL